jgi:hypothetical protein
MAAQIIVAALSVGALVLLAWDCHRTDVVERAQAMAEIFRKEE